MPFYEYRCKACGHELEMMQRITEEPQRKCPSCGGQLNRLISNTSFILKGTGWYATDYAKKSTSSPPQKESKEKSKSKDSKSSPATKED
jgi:putative FmdB family regulatory protein